MDDMNVGREIEKLMFSVKELSAENIDQRVKALIVTKLEEAQLWAMKLHRIQE